MTKTMKLAATALVPLAIAGTCLAAPLAMAVPATNVDSAAAQTVEEGTVLSKGKLQMVIPADFVVDASDDLSVSATSADGTIVAYIADVEVGEMPLSSDELMSLFDEVSTASVEQFGGTVTESAITTLQDGTEVYAYYYTMELDGTTYGTYIIFLPYETGFSFAQLAAPEGIAGDELAMFQEIAGSLVAAGAAIEAPEGYVVAEADGLAFVVPADLVDSGDGSWMSEDFDFMFGSLGVLTDGASSLTDEEYDELIDYMGSELGAVQDTATIDADGVSYKAVSFEYTEEGTTFFGIVGFVPNAQDELVGLMCLVDSEGSYPSVSEVAETCFTSVTVL